MNRIVALLALALLSLTPLRAEAYTGGRVRDVNATRLYVTRLYVPANVGYTIATSNLAPASADTVIHVQNADDPNGGYVAGNDDYGGSLASSVTIAPTIGARNLVVVVRAYSDAAGGTATLTMTSSSGAATTTPISFGGSVRTMSTALIAQSHVFTVEQQGGSSDTLALVISGSVAHAISFDDDDGVGAMSWLHMDAACSGLCQVVVGTYPSGTPGPTTLVWDEDIHFNNCDADGMGDALDRAVGANACVNDTDGDGLNDGAEVMGVVEGGANPAIKLPFYGADPTRKDVFVEADWNACTSNCGPSADVDWFRMPGDRAVAMAAYYLPEVAVHIDNGVANSDPNTRTVYGAWGGATRVSANSCGNLTTARRGLFHHVSLTMRDGNGQGYQPGDCVLWASSNPAVVAHELGHNLGLDHGGTIASGRANFKPHYRSIMNYAYSYDPAVTFSRGQFASTVLNPASLDESAGLGTSNLSAINFITQWPWNYAVNSAGAIDWNRDGVFAPAGTRVRAALTVVPEARDASAEMQSGLAAANHPVGAWLRNAAGTPVFVLLTRQVGTGYMQRRTATTSSFAGCENYASTCVTWSPATTSAATNVATIGGTLGLAAVRYTLNGQDRLLVAYPNAANQLVYTVGTFNSSNVDTWSAPALIGAGTVTDQAPTLVASNGLVYLFARVGGVLQRMVFTPSSAAWSAPATEFWSSGASVATGMSVGVTVGYQTDLAGQQLYGAIADASGVITFARRDATSSRWVSIASTGFVATNGPSLVYVPASASTPTVGRFYMGFARPGGDAWTNRQSMLASTLGNDPSATATTRRMVFNGPSYLTNDWGQANGVVSVMYDASYDDHLRAAFTYAPYDASTNQQVPTQVAFLPLADGVWNKNLRDENDFTTMSSYFACSLQGGCP